MSRWTLRSTTLALAIAIVVVASTGSASVAAHSVSPADSNVTGASVTTTGPACLGSETLPPGGLLQTTPVGDNTTVTVNTTIEHDRSVRPTVHLVERSDGEYAAVIRTTNRNSGADNATVTPSTESACRTGTHVVLTAALPSDYDRITVEVDGEVVATVESNGLFPSVTSLPAPIEA